MTGTFCERKNSRPSLLVWRNSESMSTLLSIRQPLKFVGWRYKWKANLETADRVFVKFSGNLAKLMSTFL
ncbi:MAG TPA: hypothetical protein DCZ56_01845 [Sutterella sp.]|nr:hypothetical protein [Sutterella sp.]